MSGRVMLCADDYALAPGVSAAIRNLATANRLSATSAIVTRMGWMQDAAALKPLLSGIAAGLHLNLTLGVPLGDGHGIARDGVLPSISQLIFAAHFGRLDAKGIAAEIERQLDAFEAGVGRAPDFVDGHEHVHILPVIRPALLRILKRRYAGRALLVRDPSPTLAQIFGRRSPTAKALAIAVLARNVRRDIYRHGFIANDSFGGITSFSASAADVDADFKAATAIAGSRPLVMCHPGLNEPERTHIDAIATRRQMEYEFLIASPLQIWRVKRTQQGVVEWPSMPEQSA